MGDIDNATQRCVSLPIFSRHMTALSRHVDGILTKCFFQKTLDNDASKNYITAQVSSLYLQKPIEDPQFQACLREGVNDEE